MKEGFILFVMIWIQLFVKFMINADLIYMLNADYFDFFSIICKKKCKMNFVSY